MILEWFFKPNLFQPNNSERIDQSKSRSFFTQKIIGAAFIIRLFQNTILLDSTSWMQLSAVRLTSSPVV